MDEEMDHINIVPLLDTMLVLLTIVLTTATFVANGRIPVDLAKSSAAAPAQAATLVLTMAADRSLYLNDQLVPDLASALADQDRATPVLLRADGKLALQDFVSTVDAIKQQGFAKVNLEVERP
jgi:biopolymer transport protein ExbD